MQCGCREEGGVVGANTGCFADVGWSVNLGYSVSLVLGIVEIMDNILIKKKNQIKL